MTTRSAAALAAAAAAAAANNPHQHTVTGDAVASTSSLPSGQQQHRQTTTGDQISKTETRTGPGSRGGRGRSSKVQEKLSRDGELLVSKYQFTYKYEPLIVGLLDSIYNLYFG